MKRSVCCASVWGRSAAAGVAVCIAVGVVGCSDRVPKSAMPADSAGQRPRNILLITLCSVRADHLGCYGYPRDTSPSLDAFAERAVLFERAVTQWPKTVPSFASLHTGLFPHTTGVMRTTPGHRLDDAWFTLAEAFRGAGYRTVAYVSSPPLNTTVNLNQGFEEYYETYRRPAPFVQTQRGASGWLRMHGTEPFFLWVHFNNAHVPYRPPPDLRGEFVDDELYDASRSVRINSEADGLSVGTDHPFREQIGRPDLGGVVPAFALGDPPDSRPTELDYYIAEYDACIRDADRLIGALLDSLDELNLSDRTVVAVLSDHGESLGEQNYFFEHGRLPYESCQRVPLLIHAPPKLGEGIRVAEPVGLIDVFPTLLDLAGLSVPDGVEGRSLVPVAQENLRRGDVYFCAGYHMDFLVGLRRDQWKLVRVSNPLDRRIMKGAEYELYDVVADPGEETNRYDSEPDLAGSLRRSLEQWVDPWWSRATTTVGPTSARPDPETIERMRAIGYIHRESEEDHPE